jgi:drug/metabolite transporter (DMT)-like permease
LCPIIIEKKALTRTHSTDFSLMTALLIALFSIPFFFTEPLDTLNAKVLLTIYGTSVLASFAFLEVTKGVRHMEISTSAPLFLLSPFITALLAFVVLNESLTDLQLVGMLLLAIGTYVLETKNMRDIRGFVAHFFGDHYARLILLGLCFYAITSTIDRVILGTWGVPAMLFVGIIHLFIFLNFFAYFLWQRRSLSNVWGEMKRSWKLLTLVALLTVGYRLAYSFAISLAAVALVVAIKRSSSLFTTVIGGELFHDHALLRKSVACAIMIVGVICMSLK